MNKPIYEYSRNYYSEKGEDGIVAEIIAHLGITSGLLLECGAWDGYHCSNTAHIWSNNRNFNAILVEAERIRLNAQPLEDRNPNVEAVCQYVGREWPLHDVVERSRFSKDEFVLASIDIDGDDMGAWKSLNGYEPIILIVEWNGCVYSSRNPHGVTASKWHEELEELGNYCFIGTSGFLGEEPGNMFFIRKDYKDKFPITQEDWRDRGIITVKGALYDRHKLHWDHESCPDD